MDKEIVLSNLLQLKKIAQDNGERYRVQAFGDAFDVISSLPFDKISLRDVYKLPGIGKGIYERLKEILTTGKLQEIEDLKIKSKILHTFTGIYGVGPKKAEEWYNLGYRDLTDVITHARLTKAQELGLRYYNDLYQKIPRSEIDIINDIIKSGLNIYRSKCDDNEAKFIIAGSYRRGKEEAGDVDCLFTGKDPDLFIDILFEIGLLKHSLSHGRSKFLGLGSLPNRPMRRIDFEFVEPKNWPFALLYFTGSKDFNRNMRGYVKEQGYLLNEKGLYKGRKRINLNSEAAIFNYFDVDYIPPHERETWLGE